MNTDKQIEKLHDELREIIDPDDCGWINRSTEVVIDDLIMGGVSIEKCEKTPCDCIEKCKTIMDLQNRLALHFGTYSREDVITVADVFKLINQFTDEILEGK